MASSIAAGPVSGNGQCPTCGQPLAVNPPLQAPGPTVDVPVQSRIDASLSLIAALVTGDRWLSADACAAFLGGIARRTFLEKIACLPSFPAPLPLGKVKAWKKSEVDAWAELYRAKTSRASKRVSQPYA